MTIGTGHISVAAVALVLIGGCVSPAGSAPPPPPEGWILQSEIEEPVPSSKGFETPSQVLDEYLELLGRIPGALQSAKRGERWAVLDIDAAAMEAGMTTRTTEEDRPPAPGQLRLFVSQSAGGAFTITQTVYSAPLRGR